MMHTPKILTQEEIEAGLKSLPGWKFENDKISKEFQFKDFLDALQFINTMAPIFEEHDHHADMQIMYSKVLFELQRFDAGGKVTEQDLFIADQIEQKYKERS